VKRSPLARSKPLQARKPMNKVSAKRKARKAAEKAQGAWEHMARVKALPCLICGACGVEVHHDPDPRSDWRVLPLCPFHHRREYGPQALHYNRRGFHERHGSVEDMLRQVYERVGFPPDDVYP